MGVLQWDKEPGPPPKKTAPFFSRKPDDMRPGRKIDGRDEGAKTVTTGIEAITTGVAPKFPIPELPECSNREQRMETMNLPNTLPPLKRRKMNVSPSTDLDTIEQSRVNSQEAVTAAKATPEAQEEDEVIDRVRLAVDLPRDTHRLLKIYAASKQRTLSSLVTEWINRLLPVI